ncbi:hypothetical protein LLG10_01540 [bacterium]|nr:hypothetical protein [bacterium]
MTNDKINKNNELNQKKLLEFQKLMSLDLAVFAKKRAFPNIAKCLNEPQLQDQILAIEAFAMLYETYPDEEDKLIDIFIRSFIKNQKYIAVTILIQISLLHPSYAFTKLEKIITAQKDLIEITAQALKGAWSGKEESLLAHMTQLWDLHGNLSSKKVAIMALDTEFEDENNLMIDFIGQLITDSDPFVRNQVSNKLKERFIKEPYVVEAKMREWLAKDTSHNAVLTVLTTFKDLAKRQDPNLLDRACIIMQNWERNDSEDIKATAAKVLLLLREGSAGRF